MMVGISFSNLLPASFRSVAFEVESHTESGGRRLVQHEYPLRDTPYAEDLGRKAGSWQVEAFLVRSRLTDYAASRDELRKALTAQGPGTLIHPYLGELTVCVDGYTLKESTREGGYCTFSISFVEAGAVEEPHVTRDTATATRSSAASALDKVQAAFCAAYKPLLEDLEPLVSMVPGLLAEAGEFLGAPLQIISRARAIANAALALPDILAGQVLGWLDDVTSLMDMDFDGINMDALLRLLGKRRSGGNPVLDSGTSGTASFASSVASTIADRAVTPLVDCIAAGAVINMAAATADMTFTTADDALAARDSVMAVIDTVQESGCDDTVFTALSDLRASVNEDLTTRGANLPSLTTVRLTMTMPALLASWRLYGSTDRAAAIVSRNHVRHPGRVPGGVDLEVLRD